MDQNFAVKILVEKYLKKYRKLFAAFMDLAGVDLESFTKGGKGV